MRMIDADKVKELIRGSLSVDTDADKEYVCGLIDEISSSWISVKDRMPEQAGYRCLVSAEYGDGKRCVFTAFTGYGDFKQWYTYECMYMAKINSPSDNKVHPNYKITHWMPLPEPPKEGEV